MRVWQGGTLRATPRGLARIAAGRRRRTDLREKARRPHATLSLGASFAARRVVRHANTSSTRSLVSVARSVAVHQFTNELTRHFRPGEPVLMEGASRVSPWKTVPRRWKATGGGRRTWEPRRVRRAVRAGVARRTGGRWSAVKGATCPLERAGEHGPGLVGTVGRAARRRVEPRWESSLWACEKPLLSYGV